MTALGRREMWNREQRAAIREQSEFQRRQAEWREARIRKIAAENPDLTIDDLCERFNEPRKVIVGLLPRFDGWRRWQANIFHRPNRKGRHARQRKAAYPFTEKQALKREGI